MIYLKMLCSELKCGMSDSLIINVSLIVCKSSVLEADEAHANGLILRCVCFILKQCLTKWFLNAYDLY